MANNTTSKTATEKEDSQEENVLIASALTVVAAVNLGFLLRRGERLDRPAAKERFRFASLGSPWPGWGEMLKSFRRSPRCFLIPLLIVLVGFLASVSFLRLGISAANQDVQFAFEDKAKEVVSLLSLTWSEYDVAAIWIHQAARGGNISRIQFRELYEHLIANGLEFQAAEFLPRITSPGQRAALEAESAAYYQQHYPYIQYRGIKGFGSKCTANGDRETVQRSAQDVYYPVHLVEPIEGNEQVLDFDFYSDDARRRTVDLALDTFKSVLSERIRLVQETDPSAYSVLLLHPGIPLSTRPHQPAENLSLLVIRIPALLERAVRRIQSPISVYLYSSSEARTGSDNDHEFLGAISLHQAEGQWTRSPKQEITLEKVQGKRMHRDVLSIANRKWTLVTVGHPGSFEADWLLVFVASKLILLACCCLALWVYSDGMRALKMSHLQELEAEAEKNALLAKNATEKAEAERELNDFVAHEVRNPLSAAISACSFVRTAVSAKQPLSDIGSRKAVREDLTIIDTSLQYINDLLRNMLDSSRTSNNQLSVKLSPTDLRRDVLDPVDSMLYLRDRKVEVQVECPPNLVVITDKLRIKQIILNLARNSSKFVEKGFIRLKACINESGSVQLSVEDSGPGIPHDKRGRLFLKFQASLDALNQGTGIGLSLSKDLADVLGMSLWLDEEFHSGIPDCPGARFVLDLQTPVVVLDERVEAHPHEASCTDGTPIDPRSVVVDGSLSSGEDIKLPEALSVLFVDDDMILRKLFARIIKRVAPSWRVEEASNGETAIKMIETESFDLIFVDQYMASVGQQMLGTETTRALRAKGCLSRICGLSANDVEESFLAAGANAFLTKPFPTDPRALRRELIHILQG